MSKGWIVAASGLCLAAGLGVLYRVRSGKADDAAGAARPATAPATLPAAASGTTPAPPSPPPSPPPAPPSPPPSAPADYLGVVVAQQAVDVQARLDGRLATIAVRVGDVVAQDQVLATIDVRAQHGDLLVARAALKAAVAGEDKAKIEEQQARERLGRAGKLSNVISAEELATARYNERLAKAQVESARAGVAQAYARVKQLELELSEAEIRAPFAGVVAARNADPGALVHANTPLVRLISGDALWVRFAIPEDQGRTLTRGATVKVAVTTLAAAFDAVVESVAPEIDPAARMIFAEARLTVPPEWQGKIPAGVEARVTPTAR
jgi:RND family efflux transporter MFP subunit